MFTTDTKKAKLSTELLALMSGLQSAYLTFSKTSYDNKGYEVSSTKSTIPSLYLSIEKDEKLVANFSCICNMYFPDKAITQLIGINQDELARSADALNYKERAILLKEHSRKLAGKLGLDPQDISLGMSYALSSPALSLSIDMTGLTQEKTNVLGELLKISKFTPLPSQHQAIHFAA